MNRVDGSEWSISQRIQTPLQSDVHTKTRTISTQPMWLGSTADGAASYLSSLRDELRGVELGHNALQHLIDDGWQYALVVVLPQLLVEHRQVGCKRSRQHTQGDVDHLQIWGSDISRSLVHRRAWRYYFFLIIWLLKNLTVLFYAGVPLHYFAFNKKSITVVDWL